MLKMPLSRAPRRPVRRHQSSVVRAQTLVSSSSNEDGGWREWSPPHSLATMGHAGDVASIQAIDEA